MYRTNEFVMFTLFRMTTLVLSISVMVSCATRQVVNPIKNLKIADKPITWDAERKKMSLEYMKERYGMDDITAPLITPTMIVVHWTDIPTLAASYNAFKSPLLEGREELQNASKLNVSAHFLVDRDGTIYRLLPENAFARHTIGLNHSAIGIENVGDGDKNKLTQAQFNANVKLIQYLHYKYPIRFVLGHMDYTRFKSHPLWREKDPNYITEKKDPGEDWMSKLYQALDRVGVYGIERWPGGMMSPLQYRDSIRTSR
jgi:hypothetical protein